MRAVVTLARSLLISSAARREAVRCGACGFSAAASQEAVRCGASAGRPAHGAGCPAVLGIEAPPSNSLRAPWALRSDSDGEFVDEARCARGPRPLRSSATLRRAAAHHLPPRGASLRTRTDKPHSPVGSRDRIPAFGLALVRASDLAPEVAPLDPSRQRGPGGGAVGGGEKRSGRVGARSAHPKLTRRRCLSGVLSEHEASSTAQPGREHRSGVGLTADRTRRPHPQAPAAARRTPNTPSTQRMQSTRTTTNRQSLPG